MQATNLRYYLAITAVLVGLFIAWTQLSSSPYAKLQAGIAAHVGPFVITNKDWQLAIEAANSNRREALSAQQKTQVLNRLIDEKLLLQYGLELGLAHDDPRIRKMTVQAVLGLVRANAESEAISEADIATWYSHNKEQLAGAGKRRVRYYQLSGENLSAEQLNSNAQALFAALQQGEVSSSQLDNWQAQRAVIVPEHWLPESKLLDYFGRSLTQAALAAQQPTVLAPVTLEDSISILQVTAVQAPAIPPLATASATIREHIQRQRGEQALTELLAKLRQRYAVNSSATTSPHD